MGDGRAAALLQAARAVGTPIPADLDVEAAGVVRAEAAPSLNILHILRAPLGGLFRHVVDLVAGQAERGHRVGLIVDSTTGGARADAALAELAPRLVLGLQRVAIGRELGPSDVQALRFVSRWIRHAAPDVLHGHGAKGAALARLTPSAPNAIRVYTPHGGSLVYRPGTLGGGFYRTLEWLLKWRTDLFLFESSYIAGLFRAEIGHPPGIVRVVHNGVGDAEFAPIVPWPDATDIVCLGELRPVKAFDVLIEALAILKANGRRVRAIEVALVVAVGFTVYVCYVVPGHGFAWYYFAAILGIAVLAMLAFQVADIYQVQAFRGHEKQYMRLASAWSVVFLIAIGVSFFAKAGDQFSRAWLGTFYVLGLFALIAFRRGLFLLVRRWTQEGRLDRRTVVVGCDSNGESLIRSLAAQRDSDVHIIGAFDDRGDERSPTSCAGVPKLGTVDDLVSFARATRVDLVIFSLPISAEGRILQMLKKLWVLPVDIRLSAHTNKLRYRPRSYSYVGNFPVLDVFDKPIADWDVVMKWLFDKIVGSLALLCALPIMAITAIAIKLDSRGPVLFKQKRYGFNNELIEIYKFRSMYADQSDAAASKLVTVGDPRVTRVGRFIRKTSLDELPQLFNVVFAGNLSLVGPRPHALQAKAEDRLYDEAVDGYFARHRVKPGLTGWAQIHGWRGETNSQEKIQQRVEHDLYYIENWSILLDLYIVAQTPFALLRTENAY